MGRSRQVLHTKMNVSYISLSGHVEVEKYRYLYFVITSIVYSLIICSNCTIVGLIVVHKKLHEPMYIFIAALLINSLLFSTNIFPKLMIDFLSDEQIISYQACLFQCFTFYSLSASEFLLLAAMSYDRYVSICKPLQYPTIMTGKKVSMFLALAWLLPACQIAGPVVRNANSKLCSFTLKVIFCNNTINNLFCEISRPLMMYGLVVMFNVAICPMFFILFTYVKILIITCQSCGEVRRKAAQTCLPHLLVLINYSCLFTYDMVIVRVEADLPKTACFILTLQIITYNPLFNPIIYGLKMKEINEHIKNIFLSK
ncbi:olfactory receptor 6N2-like [Melanotaenia boesemani]|uniref:olfactory receptor 6N2-like n=1 Tax=Melanotaenia boesemani TaxID=1250792 RepID=UPI001C03F640|nr:olfactory receptor 6N2-like [Melanotaenia boesemani]